MHDIVPSALPARLPRRQADAHKGDFGGVGVLGGAPGMTGAALLAARAALLCGAGRVYAGMLDERVACDPIHPELMVCAPQRLLDLPSPACLVLGPGLGNSALARQWLAALLALPHAALLDADALNLLAADDVLQAALAARAAPVVITPHPGEAGRLLGLPAAAVQADRVGAVRALARRFRAVAVLKGADTLVYREGGEVWRNTTGHPGMAAPGMGDVLSGILAALIAQGMEIEHAAVLGVWLHGTAGDRAAGLGPTGLTASEVALEARRTLNAL
ncbi:MAG: NAD(P)H-hydrate dehydratase [Betaproteobacteria bacterium]|nr:NAD(P)H-hydrate dehydratase [Betaproteobacteria bacterium]